jgi:hypothetical protein
MRAGLVQIASWSWKKWRGVLRRVTGSSSDRIEGAGALGNEDALFCAWTQIVNARTNGTAKRIGLLSSIGLFLKQLTMDKDAK